MLQNEKLPVFTDIFELSEAIYLVFDNRIRSDGKLEKWRVAQLVKILNYLANFITLSQLT